MALPKLTLTPEVDLTNVEVELWRFPSGPVTRSFPLSDCQSYLIVHVDKKEKKVLLEHTPLSFTLAYAQKYASKAGGSRPAHPCFAFVYTIKIGDFTVKIRSDDIYYEGSRKRYAKRKIYSSSYLFRSMRGGKGMRKNQQPSMYILSSLFFPSSCLQILIPTLHSLLYLALATSYYTIVGPQKPLFKTRHRSHCRFRRRSRPRYHNSPNTLQCITLLYYHTHNAI